MRTLYFLTGTDSFSAVENRRSWGKWLDRQLVRHGVERNSSVPTAKFVIDSIPLSEVQIMKQHAILATLVILAMSLAISRAASQYPAQNTQTPDSSTQAE